MKHPILGTLKNRAMTLTLSKNVNLFPYLDGLLHTSYIAIASKPTLIDSFIRLFPPMLFFIMLLYSILPSFILTIQHLTEPDRSFPYSLS